MKMYTDHKKLYNPSKLFWIWLLVISMAILLFPVQQTVDVGQAFFSEEEEMEASYTPVKDK